MPKSIFTPGQEKLQQLIRQVRTEKGLTQEELAKKLGKPQSFASKIESGERLLDVIELREVCQALGISLMDFVRRFEKLLKQQ